MLDAADGFTLVADLIVAIIIIVVVAAADDA